MARTLPWLTSTTKTSTPTTKSARQPPSKRQRLIDLSPTTTTTTTTTTTLPRLRPSSPSKPLKPTHRPAPSSNARSPSTSPPPAPPATEPMFPGLAFDDIYKMVEDEFLSTARLFTAHLHHAEYQRLKNLARTTENTTPLKTIHRPVDSITEMRAETRKKKAAEQQHAKTKTALEEISREARSGMVEVEDGEGESSAFDEDEGKEQPWQGTQLQRFMIKSPQKDKLWSLWGLVGIRANTRAAMGWGRASGGSPTSKRGEGEQGDGEGESTSEDDDDDDDLDAPSRATSRAPITKAAQKASTTAHPPRQLPKTKPSPPPRPPAKRSFLDMSPLKKPSITHKDSTTQAKPPEKHLQYAEPVVKPQIAATTSSVSIADLLARRRRLKAKREQERKVADGAGIRADEIPVFLV